MAMTAKSAAQLLQPKLNSLAGVNTRTRKCTWAAVLALSALLAGVCGCGQTAAPVVSPANGQVHTYFGGPFATAGTTVSQSASSIDHSANSFAVSGLISQNSRLVPVTIIGGSFVNAPTGFLGFTETLATTSSGIPTAQNPSLTGAWAVEIPGAGALANFLSVNTNVTPAAVSAAPTAMADNTACPNFAAATSFAYVTVPTTSLAADQADYGTVGITTQGSAVTFSAQPYLIGAHAQTASVLTGGCSPTNLGYVTAYPLNSYGSSSNLELISIGSGLLVSSFNQQGTALGVFGGGTGVIGVSQSNASIDPASVGAGQYNGFLFAPQNSVKPGYDIRVLASSFGDHSGTSPACSALQTSLAANNGQGAGTVPALPSPNSIYGGEYLVASDSGNVNDPTGASASENCDVAIDLGAEDSTTHGLFPNATVFIGSNYPPFSATDPWTCNGNVCAVSFPAAAVVGQVKGKYVIFVSASGSSNPPAQLPDSTGSFFSQPVGIYLFQK